MSFETFDIQFAALATGNALVDTGGAVQVCVAGTYHKATLYDPDNAYAALANPVAFKSGKVRFAVQTGVSIGQTTPVAVDMYGMTPKGFPFKSKGAKPGSPFSIVLDLDNSDNILTIPFAVADCTPGTEKDTGFALPSGILVEGPVVVGVTTASGVSSKTISAGLLSSQSGGSATGFASGLSLTSIASLSTSLNGGSPTQGSFLSEVSGAGSTSIPASKLIGATAVNVSYTLTSAATLAEGYMAFKIKITTG